MVRVGSLDEEEFVVDAGKRKSVSSFNDCQYSLSAKKVAEHFSFLCGVEASHSFPDPSIYRVYNGATIATLRESPTRLQVGFPKPRVDWSFHVSGEY